jgi:segregation and condensation protein B
MGFNYGLEKKNFDSQWAMTRKQYEDAGMSSEAIHAMYDYDWSVFNANRSYQNHTQEMAAPSFEQSEESYSPLMDKYQKEERGIRIIELDHAYQLCSKPEMYEYLIRIAKQPKKYVLTDVMLETLSIIAYRQPITKLEIEKIRGVKSDHAVNKLIEYNLVCELGRLDAPGRPLLFGTTEEFLRRFSVQSLDDLPGIEPEKLETFKEEAEDEAQIRLNI